MLQEVRTEESRPVPGGGIFAYPMRFEKEPRANVIMGVARLMTIEIEEWRETFGGEGCEGFKIKAALSKRSLTAHWHDHGGCARRKHLNGGVGCDVVWRDSNGRCDPRRRTRLFKGHWRCTKPGYLSTVG